MLHTAFLIYSCEPSTDGDTKQHTMFQTTKRTSFHLSPTSLLPIFINKYQEKTLSRLLGFGCHNILKPEMSNFALQIGLF
jgi:hypothetical protein